jgi:hypothetical protein
VTGRLAPPRSVLPPRWLRLVRGRPFCNDPLAAKFSPAPCVSAPECFMSSGSSGNSASWLILPYGLPEECSEKNGVQLRSPDARKAACTELGVCGREDRAEERVDVTAATTWLRGLQRARRGNG